jgi:hypothetical protein
MLHRSWVCELIVDSKALHLAQRKSRQTITYFPRLRPPAGLDQLSNWSPHRPYLILHSLLHLLRSRRPYLFHATTQRPVGRGSQLQALRRRTRLCALHGACTLLICPVRRPSPSRNQPKGMCLFPRIQGCPAWHHLQLVPRDPYLMRPRDCKTFAR